MVSHTNFDLIRINESLEYYRYGNHSIDLPVARLLSVIEVCEAVILRLKNALRLDNARIQNYKPLTPSSRTLVLNRLAQEALNIERQQW